MTELSIEEVIGRNVRAKREELGVTLSQVSKGLRVYGVEWSTGRLTHIEAGRSAASVQALALLSLVLSDLDKQGYTAPMDLLETDAPVVLGKGYAMKPDSFARLMSEGLQGGGVGDFTNEEENLEIFRKNILRNFEGYGDAVTVGDIRHVGMAFSDADYRNSLKLNLSKTEFSGACIRLWGKLLSEETESRAPDGASAQKRGRITRDLLEDLKGQIRVDRGEADESEYEIVEKPERNVGFKRKTPITYKRYKARS